nr:MAG TPA: flagellar assembly protein H [Caudoviricetes sp.]
MWYMNDENLQNSYNDLLEQYKSLSSSYNKMRAQAEYDIENAKQTKAACKYIVIILILLFSAITSAIDLTNSKADYKLSRQEYNELLENTRRKAHENGYQEGFSVGKTEGYQSGYDVGTNEGYQTGYDAGMSDGVLESSEAYAEIANAWSDGYDSGYEQATADIEAVTPSTSESSNSNHSSEYMAGYTDGYSAAGGEEDIETIYERGYETGLEAGASFDYDSAWQEGYDYGYRYGSSSSSANTASSNTTTAPQVVETPASTVTTYDYVINTSTGKFHYPWCSSVGKMNESNKWYYNGTHDDVVNMGYVPCKRCCP